MDRTALKLWREERRQNVSPMPWAKQPPHALIHLVDRSSQMSGADDVEASGTFCYVVKVKAISVTLQLHDHGATTQLHCV